MSNMMFDGMRLSAKSLPGEIRFEQLMDALASLAVAQSVQNEARIGTPGKKVSELLAQMCAAVLVDRNVVDVRERRLGLAQTIRNRLTGKSGPMLDAAKAFFFRGGDQPAVAKQSGGGIAVKCI